MFRFLAPMLALSLMLFASGCGAPGPAKPPVEVAGERPVWPMPPAEPRIAYVRSISGPRDLGIAKPFFQRLIDSLAGKSEEHLVRPTGVVEQGRVIYVADPGAQALWILDAAQNRSVKVIEIGGEPLASPVAVAVRPDGAVFVADTWLKKIFLVDREGILVRTIAAQGLERPGGLAYDAANEELYVADSATDRIAVFDAGGALVRSWGRRGGQDGEFNHPTHVALDRSGTVLVTDALNFRIQAFDRGGRFLWKWGRHGDGSGDFAAPKGLAADSIGHVFVADALFDAVQIFERDGTLLFAFGNQGAQKGQFWLPGGLFINAQDEIYVADSYNQRVQVFLGGPGAGRELRK